MQGDLIVPTSTTHINQSPPCDEDCDRYSSVTAASPAVSRSELAKLSKLLPEINFSGPPPSGYSVTGAFKDPISSSFTRKRKSVSGKTRRFRWRNN